MVGQTVETGVALAVAVKLPAPGPLGELSSLGVEVLDALVPFTAELHPTSRGMSTSKNSAISQERLASCHFNIIMYFSLNSHLMLHERYAASPYSTHATPTSF